MAAAGTGAGTEDGLWRNDDVDWDVWPVQAYLEENYRQLHPSDAAVIDHHSAFLAPLTPDGIDRSLELGAGPNLYPLMLQAAACRRIDALDRSRSNLAYLVSQLRDGPEPHWDVFYQRCRRGNPALPATLEQALTRITPIHGDARRVQAGGYGLASMHFVAETMSEDADQFIQHCARFCRSVRPGGPLVAAFMENLGRYSLGEGPAWPGLRVDTGMVAKAFRPHTTHLTIDRIDNDPTLPDYGYTGMILLTARRAAD